MTKLLKTLAIAGATVLATSTTAMAGDTAFEVKRINNAHAKIAVKAFKKGEFSRSAQLNEIALTRGLSKSRTAIVQSNLCASYAMIGNTDQAQQACDVALELRPDLKEAKQNNEALRVKLAQK